MMNPNRPAKEKFMSLGGGGGGGSGTIPRPREGLHDAGPPPFLTKTYDFVDDSATNHIVSWSSSNNSFVVWDPQAFSMSLLPKYFKHNNFSSFVRQLNTYGFRKVDPDRWEFANEGFLRGQKHLLRTIARRKSSSTSQTQSTTPHQQAVVLDPCVEVGRFGLDGEIDRLRRDKQVLMLELVKLRQQQQDNRTCLRAMEKRLKKTETKQQHMMGFLARALKNPHFVQQLVQQNDWRRELEEAINKKRRRPIDQGPGNVGLDLGDSVGVGATFVKVEPPQYGDVSDYEIAGIDGMSMETNVGNAGEEEQHVEDLGEDEIGGKGEAEEEGFWENLLNESIEDEMGSLLNQQGEEEEEEEEEDLDVLVEQLGYLGSGNPK